MLEQNSIKTSSFRNHRRQTHYSVLGIPSTSNIMQIREAYFRMKNLYNITNQALYSLVDQTEVDETLVQIKKAYEVLSNEKLRYVYHSELGLEPLEYENTALPLINTYLPQKIGATEDKTERVQFLRDLNVTESEKKYDGVIEGASKLIISSQNKGRILRVALRANNPEYIAFVQRELQDLESVSGAIFKKFRIEIDVPIEEVHHNTKVSLDVIQNIETDSFALLPQISYFKGFLLSYLNYLGIPNAKDVAAVYTRKLETWKNNKNK